MPNYPLKIVTGKVMAEIDRTAIEQRGLPGLYLMERAGAAIAERIIDTFSPDDLETIRILCGKGNNGGDGFVVARHLVNEGYWPIVILIGEAEGLSGDAKTSYEKAIEDGVTVEECTDADDLTSIFDETPSPAIWVDAMLGTGATGAPRKLYGDAVELLEEKSRYDWIVSVDIASGVNSNTGEVEGDAVPADIVYTMGLPKVGHVLPPGYNFCNKLEILDIGFPHDLIQEAESEAQLIEPELVDTWLPRRLASHHKGNEGHVLVIAGSRGMTGAALMACKSAITMGAGLLTAACPSSLHFLYASSLWEMLTQPVSETTIGSFDEHCFEELFGLEEPYSNHPYSAVIIGPGLGREASTMNLVKKIFETIDVPVLVDGDGLYALSQDDLKNRKDPWVITPHPGEMARFFDTSPAEIQKDRFGYAKRLAFSEQGAVVLKGAGSIIATAGKPLLVNPTGNPAMSTGGMGDVLSGMIGALISKDIYPQFAAAIGVYLHGLAAELVIEDRGGEAMRATEVIDYIQTAVEQIRSKKGIHSLWEIEKDD